MGSPCLRFAGPGTVLESAYRCYCCRVKPGMELSTVTGCAIDELAETCLELLKKRSCNKKGSALVRTPFAGQCYSPAWLTVFEFFISAMIWSRL